MDCIRQPTLLFFADGEVVSGMGHLRRCEGLASAAKERGWNCIFIDTGPQASAWLRERGWSVVTQESLSDAVSAIVLDSYIITDERIAKLKMLSKNLVYFHDSGVPIADFSLVVSSADGSDKMPNGTRVLSGGQYRIIHPNILAVPKSLRRTPVENIIVTFGAAPAMIDFGTIISQRLQKEFPSVAVRLIYGLSGTDAAHAFGQADIAVSGGGQSMLELSYLGVPTVAVILSPDQSGQVRDAASRGAVSEVGKRGDQGIVDSIVKAVQELYSVEVRSDMSTAAQAYIDGRGAQRILDGIAAIIRA